jgi:putative endonuclease
VTWLYQAADGLRDRARRKQWTADHTAGRRAEDLAHRFLRRLGYTVVARNYRTPTGSGEIDIVARDGESLVFVEVKFRQTAEFGTPDRAVDAEKRRRLIRAAHDYAHRSETPWDQVRFDIVSVVANPASLDHLRDAFRAAGHV